jgi:hypothetical protein
MRKFALAAVVALAFLGMKLTAGETKKVDDEGFIRNWLLLGPMELGGEAGDHNEDSSKAFFNKEYFEGQLKATPKAGDKVKVGTQEKEWKAIESGDAIYNFEEQENTINVIVAYIVCENDIPDVKLSIGSDDSSLWRLNNEELIRVYAGRAAEKDQDKSKAVTLKKGTNVLYGAVINGGGPTGACARFVDKDDKAVKNIQISLTK